MCMPCFAYYKKIYNNKDIKMRDKIKEIREILFEMRDIEYKEFHYKLIPTVAKETIIGVRTPMLRKYAKQVAKEPDIEEFLRALPHKYYEENNIHAFIIETIKDFDKCMEELEKFLPYIDNWATCDMCVPKTLVKDKATLMEHIKKWLNSNKPYVVRYGVNMLMKFYLDEDFKEEYLDMVAGIDLEEYYVKMVVAWYFATALAKQYDTAIKYIENKKLKPWTHNKTIQKARESYRITKEQKEYLKKLKY